MRGNSVEFFLLKWQLFISVESSISTVSNKERKNLKWKCLKNFPIFLAISKWKFLLFIQMEICKGIQQKMCHINIILIMIFMLLISCSVDPDNFKKIFFHFHLEGFKRNFNFSACVLFVEFFLCLEEDNEANSDLDCYSLENLQDLMRF